MRTAGCATSPRSTACGAWPSSGSSPSTRPGHRRLPRRRPLLRAVGLPDHVAAAAPSTGTTGTIDLGALLGPPGPAPAARACSCWSSACRAATPGARRAPADLRRIRRRRRWRRSFYVANWHAIVGGDELLGPVRGAVAARAHLEPGDRGAVLPGLAARVATVVLGGRRRRAPPTDGARPLLVVALVGAVASCGADDRGLSARGEPRPALPRHRHPRARRPARARRCACVAPARPATRSAPGAAPAARGRRVARRRRGSRVAWVAPRRRRRPGSTGAACSCGRRWPPPVIAAVTHRGDGRLAGRCSLAPLRRPSGS